MAEKRILLASASPRRRELLHLIAPDFECKAADADESLPDGIIPSDAVLYLSKIKALALAPSDKIIIGADTVVALGNKIIGKPKDEEDAFSILKSLSGRETAFLPALQLFAAPKCVPFSVKQGFVFMNFRMTKYTIT